MLLKEKAKEVYSQIKSFNNLSQAWKLRCDGSVEEAEHEEDLLMILKGMQPGRSGSGTTELAGGSQGRLVPVAAPLRPASKGENEKPRALEISSAAPGYKYIMNAFIKERLGQAGAFVYCL